MGRRIIIAPASKRATVADDFWRAVDYWYGGYYSQRDAAADPGAAVRPRFLAPAVLTPFISDELTDLQPIPYITPSGKR